MLLSPDGEDVLLVIHSIDVPPSIKEVGADKGAVGSFPRADLSSHCNPDRAQQELEFYRVH